MFDVCITLGPNWDPGLWFYQLHPNWALGLGDKI